MAENEELTEEEQKRLVDEWVKKERERSCYRQKPSNKTGIETVVKTKLTQDIGGFSGKAEERKKCIADANILENKQLVSQRMGVLSRLYEDDRVKERIYVKFDGTKYVPLVKLHDFVKVIALKSIEELSQEALQHMILMRDYFVSPRKPTGETTRNFEGLANYLNFLSKYLFSAKDLEPKTDKEKK